MGTKHQQLLYVDGYALPGRHRLAGLEAREKYVAQRAEVRFPVSRSKLMNWTVESAHLSAASKPGTYDHLYRLRNIFIGGKGQRLETSAPIRSPILAHDETRYCYAI